MTHKFNGKKIGVCVLFQQYGDFERNSLLFLALVQVFKTVCSTVRFLLLYNKHVMSIGQFYWKDFFPFFSFRALSAFKLTDKHNNFMVLFKQRERLTLGYSSYMTHTTTTKNK